MSEPTPPKALAHHGYKSWTSSYRDDAGRAHTHRFGRVGKVSKSEARNRWRAWLKGEYRRLKAEATAYTVGRLCEDYFAEIQNRYVANGKQTTSVNRHKTALESLTAMYGTEPADAMTAGKIAAWLDRFMHKDRKRAGKGTKTRETVNLALSYVKRMFRWGMTYKGVCAAATGSVQLVMNVRRDHPDVRHKEAIGPVDAETFQKTCEQLDPVRRAMVELMWWTGMRPGEVRSMRPQDLDTSGEIWVYKPAHHKTSWRCKVRLVALGPRAREILEKVMPSRTDQLIFQAADGRALSPQNLARAITAAATEAGVKDWNPNQIRHAYATRVRQAHGPQAVQDALGHAHIDQQAVYVDGAIERAKRLAREVG